MAQRSPAHPSTAPSASVAPGKDDRVTIHLDGTVTYFPACVADIHLLNLSRSDAHGVSGTCLTPGAQVLIGLPGIGELPAHVRWASGDRFSVAFNGSPSREARSAIDRVIRDQTPVND